MDAGLASVLVATIGALGVLWVGLRRVRHDEQAHQDERAKKLQEMAYDAAMEAIKNYREEQNRMRADQDRMRHDLKKHQHYIMVLQQLLRKAGLDVPPFPDTDELNPRMEMKDGSG